MPRGTFSKDVESAIALAARRYGLDPEELRTIAQVESSGNPKATTGSYSGLFQLSPEEFKRVGGKGDILDPKNNAMAAASLLKSHSTNFQKHFGRAPDLAELYMIHQQGWGGFQKHLENPDAPAWENMASTREGQARGEEWAKKAIVGNLTPEDKKKFGEDLTSGQFVEAWKERIGKMMGQLPRPLEPPPEGEPPQRGYQGELGASWPSAGQRIGGITSDLLRRGGMEPEPASKLGEVVGTVGEWGGAGLGQELGRSGALLATQPSREAAKSFAWEAGGATPWGKGLKSIKTIGGLGITAGGPKRLGEALGPLSEGPVKGPTSDKMQALRDFIEAHKAVKGRPPEPELPEGMRWERTYNKKTGKHEFKIMKKESWGGESIVGELEAIKKPGEAPYAPWSKTYFDREKGFGTKLYNRAEQTFGEKMVPSDTLLKPGYGFWQSRDPKAVSGYDPTITGGEITGWHPRWKGYSWEKKPKPGDPIKEYHGSPVDPSKLKYPEYQGGKDPFDKIRVQRPIITYHGGPHDIPAEKVEEDIYPLGRFRWEKIGSGEGHTLYHKGHYSAEAEAVGKEYRDLLSELKVAGGVYDLDDPLHTAAVELSHRKGDRATAIRMLEGHAQHAGSKLQKEVFKQAAWALRQNKELPEVSKGGHLYEIAIHANPDHFVDLDKPIADQSDFVKSALKNLGIDLEATITSERIDEIGRRVGTRAPTLGSDAIRQLREKLGDDDKVSRALRKAGIPGLRYFDLGSREAGKGTRNYVVMNEHIMEILRKYGFLPPIAAGATAAAMSQPGKEEAAAPQEF